MGARPKKSICSMCRIMGQMPIVNVLARVQINSGTWGIFKGTLSAEKWFHVGGVGGPRPTGLLGALNSSFVYGQPVLWGLSGTQIDPWRSMKTGENVRIESAPTSTTLSSIPNFFLTVSSEPCLSLWGLLHRHLPALLQVSPPLNLLCLLSSGIFYCSSCLGTGSRRAHG